MTGYQHQDCRRCPGFAFNAPLACVGAVIGLATTGRFHRRAGLLLIGLYVVYIAGLVVVPMVGGL